MSSHPSIEDTLRRFLTGRVIFVSVIGSTAWGMNRPESDLDLFGVVIDPIDRVLFDGPRGGKFNVVNEEGGGRIDLTLHELSKFVRFVHDGNPNFVLAAASPIYVANEFGELMRRYLLEHRNDNIIRKAINMGYSVLRSVERGKFEITDVPKITRMLVFARRWVEGKSPEELFSPEDTIGMGIEGLKREIERLEGIEIDPRSGNFTLEDAKDLVVSIRLDFDPDILQRYAEDGKLRPEIMKRKKRRVRSN